MDPDRRREIASRGGASVPSEKRSFAQNRGSRRQRRPQGRRRSAVAAGGRTAGPRQLRQPARAAVKARECRSAGLVRGHRKIANCQDRRASPAASAGAARQGVEASEGELVGVLGVDRLAGHEGKSRRPRARGLKFSSLQAHFNAAFLPIPRRLVRERLQRNVAAEFAVDAGQQVEVERRGDACSVIVSRDQRLAVLGHIDPDDEEPSFPSRSSHPRMRATASSGAKLPMVEPGKKPWRLVPPPRCGSSRSRVKSPPAA